MRYKLYIGLTVIGFLFLLGTAMAISLHAQTGGSGGHASFSGKYDLDDSSALSSSINLDSDSLTKETKAQGSGLNSLDESVSTGKNSVQNAVACFGLMSMSSSSSGSSEGVVVNQDADLAGIVGFIATKSVSPTNEMTVAGGFDETGDLNEHISSYSGEVAAVEGTVSSAGVELLNDEIAQVVSSGKMEMAVEGLSKSKDGANGKFGLAAVNRARGASLPVQPSGTSVTPNGLTATNDPNVAGEIMNNPEYLGSMDSHDSEGVVLNAPLQLYLRADKQLTNEKLDPQSTGKSIATAAATWDDWTNANLFTGNVIVSSNAVADKGDGYAVHAFKSISGNAIAYNRIWTYSGTNIIADSDVCYNTRNQWTLDWGKANWPTVDVQSIALHELGHSVGLSDLYLLPENDPRSQDWYQTMNSYDGRQRYLGSGDIAGLRQIYGA